MTLCEICFQPECEKSVGEVRPESGVVPSRLAPGEREYRGYGEWAISPDEARVVLHRGFAVVDGKRRHVHFIFNEFAAAQVYVDGTGGQSRYPVMK